MINEDNPIPLHLQVKGILKEEIVTGKYRSKIPSERELMNRFGVSRTTIREAINHLVNEGLLIKQHGKGTFIRKQKPVQEWLHTLNSLTDTIERFGMKPGSKLLAIKRVTNHHISKRLGTDHIYLIKRLRTADDIPIAIERHFVPVELGEKLKSYDLNKITIYHVMEQDLNIKMYEAEQVITCKEINKEDAEHLQIEDGTNVLFVDRIIRDVQGEIIEYYKSTVKPTMYEFRLKMKR